MVGYRKLALIAAVAALWAGSEVQAAMSPFVSDVFIAYSYSGNSGWARGTGIFMRFVNWHSDNPEFTVKNLSWVEKWAGDGGSLHKPDWVEDPPGSGRWVDDSVPPWKDRASIPEPGTALLVGGLMSIVALRRRAM